MEKTKGTIWKEILVLKRLEKKVSTQLRNEELKESLSVIRIEQEQFSTLPRVEVCGATVGYVRP